MKAVYTLDDLRHWQHPEVRFAVLGDPVAHSASPSMHNAALAALGRTERYGRLCIRPEELPEALHLLPTAGFLGVNLTLPHKTAALPLLHAVTPHAARLGAVNTIVIRDGQLTGHNTDGPGILRAIWESFAVDPASLRVLLLGAGGGAGRAIATQCVLAGCPQVTLVNRTLEKIVPLARQLGSTARTAAWSDASLAAVLPGTDLIINASSVGMAPGDPSPLPAALLDAHHLVYDTIYVGDRTPLQTAAAAAGARSANGLSLLLHQGALALEIWLGHPAPLDTMRQGLQDFIARRQTGK